MNEAKTNRAEFGIDQFATIVRDFNICFSAIEELIIRQKIKEDIENLNNIINQQYLIGIYKTLYPIIASM